MPLQCTFSSPSPKVILGSSWYSVLISISQSSSFSFSFLSFENTPLNSFTMIEEDCATIKTTKGHQRVVEAFGLSPTRWWNKRQLNARNTWSTQDHLGEFQPPGSFEYCLLKTD